MNPILKKIRKEFEEFKLFHKNPINIKFHVLCGFIYMTFLFLTFKSIRYELFILYSFVIYKTIKTPYLTYLVLFILMEYFAQKNINVYLSFLIFIIFYMLPELSHYLTNEKTVLIIDNITPLSVIINIFYLLPFSAICLLNKPFNTLNFKK